MWEWIAVREVQGQAAAFEAARLRSPFDQTVLAPLHLSPLSILDSKFSKVNQHGHSITQGNPLVSTQMASAALLSDHRKAYI